MSARVLIAPSHAGRRNIGFAAMLGAGFLAGVLVSGALASGSSRPVVGASAPIARAPAIQTDVGAYRRYRTALADLAAAQVQHDSSAVARYQANVDRLLGEPSVVGAIYADRARLAANMAAAEQRLHYRGLARAKIVETKHVLEDAPFGIVRRNARRRYLHHGCFRSAARSSGMGATISAAPARPQQAAATSHR